MRRCSNNFYMFIGALQIYVWYMIWYDISSCRYYCCCVDCRFCSTCWSRVLPSRLSAMKARDWSAVLRLRTRKTRTTSSACLSTTSSIRTIRLELRTQSEYCCYNSRRFWSSKRRITFTTLPTSMSTVALFLLPIVLSIGLLVCLSVGRTAQKVVNEFLWNFWWDMTTFWLGICVLCAVVHPFTLVIICIYLISTFVDCVHVFIRKHPREVTKRD